MKKFESACTMQAFFSLSGCGVRTTNTRAIDDNFQRPLNQNNLQVAPVFTITETTIATGTVILK